MMRRLFTLLLTSLLGWAGAAQAQATIDYPDAIRMIRVDGTKIMLINRADGPDGIRYFLYSEPGSNFGCVGPGFASSTATNKPQSMNALSVTLDKIFAKWINQLNRTAVLFDERGDSYHVQLPRNVRNSGRPIPTGMSTQPTAWKPARKPTAGTPTNGRSR